MTEVKFLWQDPISPDVILDSWMLAFNRSMPKDTWSKLWSWRFINNPESAFPLAAYILINNEIACYYGVSPLKLISPQGYEIKSGLMNMGFTHPEYHRQGLYLELNKQLHNKLQEQGFQAIFGFANHNSHYSYRKHLNWKDIALLTNFQYSTQNRKIDVSSDSELQTNTRIIDEDLLSTLEQCISAMGKYHGKRSANFLRWRISDNPYFIYSCIEIGTYGNPLAWAIVKDYNGIEVDIMEIFYYDEVAFANERILFALVNHLDKMNYSSINLWSNLYSNEHLTLEKIGFTEKNAITYFGVIDFTGLEGIGDIRNWHYRFIDSDNY
jgi:hypothetical protein